MADTSFKKYLEEKIKQYPKLKSEIEKTGRAVKIAHQIYKLRKHKGLTQSQLAKRIGVSQSNIARIEHADYNHYTMKTLYKVAEGLGADLNIFINLPEQTINLTRAVNSFPTFKGFTFAGTAGEYCLSGRGIFKTEEAITPGADIESAEVKVSAESKESKANWLYYQAL